MMEEDTQCLFQLLLLGTSSRTCTYMHTHIYTLFKKHKIANFMLVIPVVRRWEEAGLSALSFFSVERENAGVVA